jgi:hypothetical protein
MKPGMTPVFDVVGAGFNGLMSQTAIRNFGFTDQEPHRRHDRRNAREPAGAPTATSRSQRQISAIWSGPDRSDVCRSRAVSGAVAPGRNGLSSMTRSSKCCRSGVSRSIWNVASRTSREPAQNAMSERSISSSEMSAACNVMSSTVEMSTGHGHVVAVTFCLAETDQAR